MSTPALADRPAWKLAALAAFAAACAWLLYRNLGLHPNIFIDELNYSKMSRMQEFKDALVPSYLYLWIFRGTNACGTAFYDCVHIANVIFFVAAAPLIYLTAQQVTSRRVAAFLALLAVIAPINLYTAYFMPEATYYFGFWVLSWIALTRTHWHWAAHGAATGVVLGLLSLIKVHGLFLVPALCLFLVYARWSAGGRWLATALGSVAVALAGIAAMKFGVGYLLAGDAAFNLFGNFYQGAANMAGKQKLAMLIGPALTSGRGHLAALALLLPLPLALVLQSVLRPPARGDARQAALLQLYALLMLGAAMGVTVLFAASISALDPRELQRLHLRYYDFVFPALWLVAAAALGTPAGVARPAVRWGIVLPLFALLIFAFLELPSFALNPADGPDLFALSPKRWAGRVLLVLDAAILLLWARDSRLAAPLFLFVALPFAVVAGAISADITARAMGNERPVDRATAAALRHVPSSERGSMTVAGADEHELMRALFRIDSLNAGMTVLQDPPVIEQYQIPVRRNWLLVLGDVKLPEGVRPLVRNNEFSLVRLNSEYRRVAGASLTQPFGTGLIASAQGLSGAEPWGRWSDGKQVVMHLSQPLPQHARIVLKAAAYDVNAERMFTLHVGDQSVRFRLGWTQQEVGLVFDTDGNQRDLVIDVPEPVRPSSRGLADNRALGIALSEIEIGAVDEPSLATK